MAFEALVRRWEAPSGRFLARLVGDVETVQDLQQEVFLRMYLSGANLRTNGTFRAWLYTVALNVARDQPRKPERSESLGSKEVIAQVRDVDANCERQELSDLQAQQVSELFAKIAQTHLALGNVEKAQQALRDALEQRQSAQIDRTHSDAASTRLPEKLVISASKKSLDQVATKQISEEEFTKSPSIEHLAFSSAQKNKARDSSRSFNEELKQRMKTLRNLPGRGDSPSDSDDGGRR